MGIVISQLPLVESATPSLLEVEQGIISYLERLTEGDHQFLSNVISAFLRGAERDMHALHLAITAKDGPKIKELTHRLKGSSSNIGADRMADLCRQVDLLVERGDFARLHQERLCLQSVYDQAKSILLTRQRGLREADVDAR